jgi:hypothetical protein
MRLQVRPLLSRSHLCMLADPSPVVCFPSQSTQFDKKSYMVYLKDYMKTLKKALAEAGKSEEEVKAFEKRAAGVAKKILGNFKDYEFYTGESMNPEGMVALLNYREDGVTPYLTFWRDGLKEVKI